MKNYPMVKLGDDFILQMGKTPSRSNVDYWHGDISWVSIADIGSAKKFISNTKERISKKAINETGIKIVPQNTLIMSFKLSIGKTAITAKPIYTNEAIMAFIPKREQEYDISYLYHLFSNKDWSIGSNNAVMGTTLNKTTLSITKIPKPPLSIQKEISLCLDKIENLISKRKEQLSKLDELAKSRFIEMFGDVKEDKCVSDVVEFLSRGKSPQYIEKSKVKVLNQACIYWDEIKYEKVKFQDSSKVNPMAILHSNDLIITSTGTGTLGRCNIFIQPDKYTYTADSHLTMVRLKKNLINELYLKTFFSLDSTQKDLYRSCVNGSTNQIELSKDKLLKFKIKTPKIEHQLEYFNLVQQLDKSKFRIKKSLEKLEMTYKALLQEYFG